MKFLQKKYETKEATQNTGAAQIKTGVSDNNDNVQTKSTDLSVTEKNLIQKGRRPQHMVMYDRHSQRKIMKNLILSTYAKYSPLILIIINAVLSLNAQIQQRKMMFI